jgi:hypothetical protein
VNAKSKSLIVFLFVAAVVATALAASALIYYRKSAAAAADKTKSESAKHAAERRYRQILIESSFAGKRSDFFARGGESDSESADPQALISMGENAALLPDAEALATIARKLETLIGGAGKAEVKKQVESFKIQASELYAVRARSKRFETHQINSKIAEINRQLQASPRNAEKAEERDWLEKTRAVLQDEYPRDAERAIELNPENFRALYDLARFWQARPGDYDKRIVIKNYEKVVALGNGKFEKDADYLRANLNLTVLYYHIGDWAKAKCYSSQTMEKYLARGKDDYEYLFSKTPEGSPEEPEFVEAVEKVNPDREMKQENCAEIKLISGKS